MFALLRGCWSNHPLSDAKSQGRLTIASMSARLACVRSEDALGSESEASFPNRAGAYPEYAASTATNEHGRLDDRNPPVTPLAFGLLPALHGGVVLFVLGDAACRLRPLTVLRASRSPVRGSESADRGGLGGGPDLESAVRMRQGPAVGRQPSAGVNWPRLCISLATSPVHPARRTRARQRCEGPGAPGRRTGGCNHRSNCRRARAPRRPRAGRAFRDQACRKLDELIGSGQHLRRMGPEPEPACGCFGVRRPRSARASAPTRVGRRSSCSQERSGHPNLGWWLSRANARVSEDPRGPTAVRFRSTNPLPQTGPQRDRALESAAGSRLGPGRMSPPAVDRR